MKVYKDVAERIEKIKKLIPDKNTRNLVFNFDDEYDDFLSDDDLFLSYFSNILLITSSIVLHIFLKWKNDLKLNKESEKNTDFSNSLCRIYNMLDRVYDPLKFNGDFIGDLIINLNIDYLLSNKTSTSFIKTTGISDFFRFNVSNNRLTKYIYYLKQKNFSSKYICDRFGFEQLCECIKIFSFLQECKITFLEQNGILQYDGLETKIRRVRVDVSEITNCPFTEIDLKHSIYIINTEAYFVEDYDFFDPKKFSQSENKEQKLCLNYCSFSNMDNFKFYITDFKIEPDDKLDAYYMFGETFVENFILDYDIINVSSKKMDPVFFKDYFLLNNKYIKELSLTITDTLSIKTKNIIKKTYEAKYAGVFKAMYVTSLYNNHSIVSYRWDEIILFLLLEEGIHDFLHFFLRYEKFDSLINSFERRYGEEKIESICNAEPFILNHSAKFQYSTSKNDVLDCQAKAIVLLASKLFTLNEWNLEKSYYPTTIDDIIAELERINSKSESDYSESEKILYFTNTVLRVLLFINNFYRGIFKYARCKKNSILELEVNGLSYATYKAYSKEKENWIYQMNLEIKNSKQVKIDIQNHFPKKLYTNKNKEDVICKIRTAFSMLIETNNNFSDRRNSNNEILFETLGKRNLFDTLDMEGFKERIIFDLQSSSIQNLYISINDFLRYLKTGNVYDNRCIVGETYNIENAIYPIVGQYYCGVTSRDGYRYSFFRVNSLNLDKTHTSLNIKMISDDQFDFGYSYYCVPNANRIASFGGNDTADRIWISPIIIPCSIFLPQLATQIEQLDDPVDFDGAVELIYESDPYVYKRLFGSIDNAKIIMPILLEDKNSKFFKKHYYIMKQDEEVVAVASLYKSSDYRWNTDNIRFAFDECNIALPETFEMAVNCLNDIFNDYIGNSYCLIDDLCVREDYRNRGLGKSMVMYLSKEEETEGRSVILSVYNENNIAFNLYSSVGFIPYANVFSDSEDDRNYIKMIKK